METSKSTENVPKVTISIKAQQNKWRNLIIILKSCKFSIPAEMKSTSRKIKLAHEWRITFGIDIEQNQLAAH